MGHSFWKCRTISRKRFPLRCNVTDKNIWDLTGIVSNIRCAGLVALPVCTMMQSAEPPRHTSTHGGNTKSYFGQIPSSHGRHHAAIFTSRKTRHRLWYIKVKLLYIIPSIFSTHKSYNMSCIQQKLN